MAICIFSIIKTTSSGIIIYRFIMNTNELLISKANFVETKSNQNIQDSYVLQKEIGKGAYGVVYRGVEKNGGGVRAIKKIVKKTVKNPRALANEIQSLIELDHPTILKVYEVFEDTNFLYIVTDLCEGGELFDRLEKLGSFSEKDARKIFLQLMEAVNYCHKEKVAHRDLKPENILFLNSDSMSIKLIDFGLAFRWNKGMREELLERNETKLVGTSYYLAPEIIAGSYDQRCDIWSAGVILYILITAVPPFDGSNDREIIASVKKGYYTFNIPEMKSVSSECKDLIQKLLMPESSRITIEGIFEHPWMKVDLPSTPLHLNFKRMTDFCKYSKLKKITANFIASKLSEKQIENLSEVFKKMDKNHDGALSMEELKIALAEQKEVQPYQELKKIIEGVDTDHNGLINYTEFIASTFEQAKIFTKENLLRFFNSIDKDHNGSVDKVQLREILQRNNFSEIHGKEIDDIMNECDKNKDGKIDFNEFCTVMLN